MAYLKMYGGRIVPRVKIVSWSAGTDAEIAAMLNAHYAGQINIYDHWDIGDERTVHLSAMSATGVSESHVAQDVTMVLMNKGGKTLTTAINGITECAFIVGQKNCLGEKGYMNSSNTTNGGWNACARRTWCNSVYKNAMPSTLIEIFKEHQNIAANGTGSTAVTSNDYFALQSTKEVLGSASGANATVEANNKQFKYYETSANRIKKLGDSGSATDWWVRSPYNTASTGFCYIGSGGSGGAMDSSGAMALAPFGVI